MATARLEARISTDLQASIKHVAEMQNRTVTDFVVTAVQDAIQRAMEQASVIRLTREGQIHFAEVLINPPPMTAAMKRAKERHSKLVIES